MNTKEKIELSHLILEKAREINELAVEVEKEGLKVEYDVKEDNTLYAKVEQIITYIEARDDDTYVYDEKTIETYKREIILPIIEKIDKKLSELCELVHRAHKEGLTVQFDTCPLHVDVTETIIYQTITYP